MPKARRIVTYSILALGALACLFSPRLLDKALNAMIVARQEYQRVASPDNELEAVLYSLDAGATTSEAFHFAIVSRGTNPDSEETSITVDHVDHPEAFAIKWLGNSEVAIHVPSSRLFRSALSAKVSGRTIKITRT